MMKSNDSAIRAMQELLMARCKEEPDFLLKMSRPDKTMEKAVNYVCNCIKEMGVCMVDDNTVLGLLSDYFDGDTDDEKRVRLASCLLLFSLVNISVEHLMKNR